MAKIKLQPHASSTIDLMRFNGYSTVSAIADIVDNTLPVGTKKIEILIEGNSSDNLQFLIYDDGFGMDKNELESAMHLSSKDFETVRIKNDLGKFGFGLKSASFSQCKELTVISKKKGFDFYSYKWDLNYVKENNDWSVDNVSVNEIDEILLGNNIANFDQGTVVIWNNCDRVLSQNMDSPNNEKYLAELVNDIHKNLSLIYHKYLNKGLKIFINGIEVYAMDPFCEKGTDGHRSTIAFEEKLVLEGKKINIKGYLLPHLSKLGGRKKEEKISIDGDLLGNQGLYFYRVNRLISWGSWHHLIRKTEANKLARIDISIGNDLDHIWNIEIKKSTITIPFLVKNKIRDLMKNVTQQSNRVGARRVTRPIDKFDLWKRTINKDTKSLDYSINRNHPLIEEVINNNNIDKDIIYSLLEIIEKTTPIEYIKNDISQNEYKLNKYEFSEFEEKLRNLANGLRLLGVSYEVFRRTEMQNSYANIEKKDLEIILSNLKNNWSVES